ncbi:MAG: hypothetical protein Q9173_007204 [Seirophora scorigena]
MTALELGSVFSGAKFKPARRAGGNGGGFEEVVDDEFVGDGCVCCDKSSESDVDLLDSLVEDLDLVCWRRRARGKAGALRFESPRPERFNEVDKVSKSSTTLDGRSGLCSIGIGDPLLGGGGKGLSSVFESHGMVGGDGDAKDVDGKLGSGGEGEKFSKATVWGAFCFTSFPWWEIGTEGRFRPV